MSEPSPGRFSVKNGLLILGIVAVLVGVLVWAAPWLWELFHNPKRIRDWIQSFGVAAPAVFLFLQVLQVVVFVLPGEVTQIAGGWVFGFGWGSGLSILGIAAGSSIAFGLTRWLGVAFVHRIAGADAVEKFDHMMASPKFVGSLFLFFLIPGIPKDVLCYVAGLSRIKFVPFLLISSVARLPGILGSSVMGTALFHGDWVLLAGVATAAAALFGVGWWFRDSIFLFIERFALSAPPAPKDAPHEPH
jgi:uncharacterized membrane protein YdjX (TVP38/TMEM64 family)